MNANLTAKLAGSIGSIFSVSLLYFASPVQIQAATTLPGSYQVPTASVDTTKPGFLVRTWRSPGEPNTIAWAEDQLAGLHGANNAQLSVFTDNIYGNSYFDETGVINYWNTGGQGNFPNDVQNVPGLPNDGSNIDSYSIEAFAILDLPAGTTRMGVNSDDGFRVYALQSPDPRESFARLNVGQFDGGRGVGDTTFDVTVPAAGFYSFRLVYEEGGGDSAVEWFTVKTDGSKHLINDATDTAAIKAYRVGTASLAVITKALPTPGSTAAAPNAAIEIGIVDGSNPIDPTTVKLSLDNVLLSVTPTKNGNVTSAKYTPPAIFMSGSLHNVSLTYTENGNPVTANWTFKVVAYTTIPAADKVTPDTTKPGFVWNYYANSDPGNTGNTTDRAEADLALRAADATGALLPNLGDPNAKGVALAAAALANPVNAPLQFEIAGVINLNGVLSSGERGDFTSANGHPDDQEPGAPSTDGTTDGQAAEILTYLTLPAGLIQMGVNSDDGFSTAAGSSPKSPFGRVELGSFVGGRGASDTLFYLVVEEAGTYPFRTIWENGGGESNIEWFTVKPDGVTKVLVNDVANGGVPAYRAITAPAVPYVKSVIPTLVPRQLQKSSTNVSLLLADGANPVDDNSVTLKINGKNIPLTKTRQGSFLTVNAVLDALYVSGEAYTGALTYRDSTGAFSRTQQWTFYNLQNLILPATPVTGENFDSYPEAPDAAHAAPPGWALTNYSWLETGASGFDGNAGAVWDLTAQHNDPYLNWCMVTTDTGANLEREILLNDTSQTINGIPVTDTLWMSGNCLFAASDSRARRAQSFDGTTYTDLPADYAPQIQIAVSAPFNLSTVTNPVLTFSSSVRISGNGEEDGLEYSVDNGTTWLPVIFMFNANRLFYNPDGSYDAVETFTHVWSDVARFPVVQDPTTRAFISAGPLGQKFGDVLKTPISAALSPYIANRNDTALARKVEAIRLPAASKKSQVRLRFNHYGSCGWQWAIDNIAFYDIAPPGVAAQPRIDSIAISGGQVRIQWSNGGTLESTPSLDNPVWTSTGNSSGSFTESPSATGNKYYRVKQ